jgi:hypothetical protein
MVIIKPTMSCVRLFFKRPQCAQVSVAPEVHKISVLIAGIPHADIGVNLGILAPGPLTS